MVVISALLIQTVQMALVVLLAPLLTGFIRLIKARLLRRRGPSIIQPYRDILRLLRKDVVLAENASWLFRVTPYLIFAVTWVAAAIIPTFATGLIFSWTADLIAIITPATQDEMTSRTRGWSRPASSTRQPNATSPHTSQK